MFNMRMGKIEDVILDFSCGETGNLIESNLQFCRNEGGVTSHICFKVFACS